MNAIYKAGVTLHTPLFHRLYLNRVNDQMEMMNFYNKSKTVLNFWHLVLTLNIQYTVKKIPYITNIWYNRTVADGQLLIDDFKRLFEAEGITEYINSD